MKRNLVWILIGCTLLISRAAAQTGTTSLRGTIADKTGGVIQGAKVTLIRSLRGGAERTGITTSSGGYEFLSLPPGTYSLDVEMTGFRKYHETNLQLLVESPATVNVTLEIGSTTETIEVIAQTETLNTTNASIGNAFNENQVKELPLEGRNIPDLLSLQTGVAVTGNRPFLETRPDVDTRNGAVNGAHSDQSNVTLDGVDVNDQTRGYAFTSVLPVTPDSLQEFRVTTTNYDANQGRSSGAQVSLVTKSGTNNFHGTLYEYHRNTITSANDYFVKISEAQNGQPNVPPKLIRNQFGASFGGPFRKDRFFFFANYEGHRQREEASILRIVPSLALRDGVVQYLCATPAACPGGTVQGLTGPHTIQAGYEGLSPQDVSTLDPLHLPSNAAMISYFNTFPSTGFDTTQGDGVNFVGFRFRGAVPTNTDWYIARLDYKITDSGNHTIFWSGGLRNDFHDEAPYLPLTGQGPQRSTADYSKGFSAGYTAILRPTLVNNFRWGYIRQSFGTLGNSDKPFIQFRGLNDDTTPDNSSLQVVRTNVFQVPLHNLTDDVSWARGKHTLQFGVDVGFLRASKNNTLSSFSSGIANPSFLPSAGIANTGIPGDPGASGFGYSFPTVDPNFNTNFDYPFMALLGSVSQVNATYNFKPDGTVLPQGAPLSRHFAANSYEFYAQDSWKVKPNLTLTYGLRYSLLSPPWETNGVEVTPTMNLGDWFNLRAQNMNKGIGAFADPIVSLDLSGPANGKPGFYNWDYHDFGPRLAVAWSPDASGGLWKKLFGGAGKTSVRAGFGIVYDRIGQGLLATFDKRGSFGLSTSLTNTNGGETLSTAPRLTDVNTIPTTDLANNPIFTPPPSNTAFPQTPPFGSQNGAFTAANSVDQSVKTPYSYTIDLSVARELGHDFSIEVSYVGRLSHRLLALEDLAQPADLVDPKTKVDYFSAVQALAKLYEPGGDPTKGVPASQITPAMVGPTAQYWYDMTQPLVAGGAYSLDPTTASFCTPSFNGADALQTNYALFSCYAKNETSAIQRIDQDGFPDPNNTGVIYHGNCGATGSIPNCYLNSQYVSLLAWRSVGTASYHALQVSIRKRLSRGVQFDLNYTYSKSIDLESDAERVDLSGAGALGFIQNAWRPKQSRGVSDFDTPHQINANWIVELPFGKGKLIEGNAGKSLDAVIGGWQLSGLARWSAGFPTNILNGSAWPTNWQFNPNATQVGPAVTRTVKNPDGSVNIFPDPQGPTGLGAFAATLPGSSGSRNTIRGDGFAGFDAGLSKRWIMPWKESESLQFRWEVFNVLNLTRFDVQTITANIDQGSAFGNYSGLSTNPRVMQFALRFEF